MSGPSTFTGLRRVETYSGSHIDPPCDESWDDFTKLRWQAAVTEADTGIRVSVARSLLTRRYSVMVGQASIGSFDFARAWTFLNGVSIGAREATRVSGADL